MRDQAAQLAAFAHRLKIVCKFLCFSLRIEDQQAILRKICGVTENVARKWLIGEAYPSITECQALVSEINISLDWLLTGVDCCCCCNVSRGGSTRFGDVSVMPHMPWSSWCMENRVFEYFIIGRGAAGVMATWRGDLDLLLSGLSDAIKANNQLG